MKLGISDIISSLKKGLINLTVRSYTQCRAWWNSFINFSFFPFRIHFFFNVKVFINIHSLFCKSICAIMNQPYGHCSAYDNLLSHGLRIGLLVKHWYIFTTFQFYSRKSMKEKLAIECNLELLLPFDTFFFLMDIIYKYQHAWKLWVVLHYTEFLGHVVCFSPPGFPSPTGSRPCWHTDVDQR